MFFLLMQSFLGLYFVAQELAPQTGSLGWVIVTTAKSTVI